MVRRVLEVTLDQLAARGFEMLSVPEVAALAGVNKTSVYRRWPTKSDLVRQALTASLEHDQALPSSGDLRTDLLTMTRAAVQLAESPRGMGVMRTLLTESSNAELRSVAASMFRAEQSSGPRRLLARAMARGDLPKDADVKTMLTTIAGALMHRIVVERARVTDAFLERLIDLVLYGVTAR